MTTHEKALKRAQEFIDDMSSVYNFSCADILAEIDVALSALTPPDVASQRCDDALFSSIGLLRALGRSDQTVHVAISELEYVRQFVSTLTHLAAENALLRERDAEVEGLLQEADFWIEGALNCKSWHWDADQHEAATDSLQRIRAARRVRDGGKVE